MNSLLNSPAGRIAPTAHDASLAQPTPEELRTKRLRNLHRFAGLTLATFIVLHLSNHLVALVSVEQHIKVMEMLRVVYRNPIVETLLLLAILVQVPSGIGLVRRKGWRGLEFAERAQVASGLYLSFFLVAHVFAVMAGRFIFHLDTNFYFGSAPLQSFLWLFYVLYYGLSVVAIFSHVGSLHYLKMLPRTSLRGAQMQGLVIVGTGVIVMVLILLAFSGVVYEIRLPAAYKWW